MTGTPMNILIADDDAGDRKLLKRTLQQTALAHHLVECADMPTALDACEKHTFDFAFLDYQMPGNQQLEGIAELHDHARYTAIILMTGQGDEEVASTAIKLGALDYIPKRAIVVDSLRRIINNSQEKMSLQRKIDEQRDSLLKFSHILVHDLKGPIRHINTFGALIQKSIAAEKYQDLQTYCDHISTAVLRMGDLIDALDAYNQLDVPAMVYSEVCLQSLIQQCLDDLSPVLQLSHAQITYDKLPKVFANRPQISQLLQNLIGNGLKYCEADTPKIHISSQQVAKSIRICVADNGIGIDERYYKKIFAPFQRLHPMGDTKFPGSGIGLATCKKIIDRHDGDIWCESQLGTGSKFYFTLPIFDSE